MTKIILFLQHIWNLLTVVFAFYYHKALILVNHNNKRGPLRVWVFIPSHAIWPRNSMWTDHGHWKLNCSGSNGLQTRWCFLHTIGAQTEWLTDFLFASSVTRGALYTVGASFYRCWQAAPLTNCTQSPQCGQCLCSGDVTQVCACNKVLYLSTMMRSESFSYLSSYNFTGVNFMSRCFDFWLLLIN